MTSLPAALSLLLAGCTQVRSTDEVSLPSEGVFEMFADSDRGHLSYAGADSEGFDIAFTSRGKGLTRRQAEKRSGENSWGAAVDGDLLDVWARSSAERASVDIAVSGPRQVSIEAVMVDGNVRLENVEGSHLVTANRIEGVGLVGDVDFYAEFDGIDVEVQPYVDSVIRLDAQGDVVLRIPYGLEYDLEALVDPGFSHEISDLGFDDLYVLPDYVGATTGSRAIRIEVLVVDGTFFLWEAGAPR